MPPMLLLQYRERFLIAIGSGDRIHHINAYWRREIDVNINSSSPRKKQMNTASVLPQPMGTPFPSYPHNRRAQKPNQCTIRISLNSPFPPCILSLSSSLTAVLIGERRHMGKVLQCARERHMAWLGGCKGWWLFASPPHAIFLTARAWTIS